MRKLFTTIAVCGIFHFSASSQDLALQSPFGSFSSPVSGCSLGNETVTVDIVALGTDLTAGTTFTVSFSIDGVVQVTDNVMLGANLLANSVYTHTFSVTAPLSSVSNTTYDFDATVTLTSVADINTSNDTYSNYMVTNSVPSVGGTVAGGTTVCFNTNSGNLTLSGHTGTVLNWEYSDDGGITWLNLSNTTTSQSYDDLTLETWYRANVQNAGCAVATSSIAIVDVDPTSVGGSTSGGTSPSCAGSNSGTITLSGKTGNVLKWQFSTDGGATWTDIANTGTTNPYLNLTTTTRYRAQVQSGVCASAFSTQRIVVINPNTVGGTISSDATECSGSNAATLTLSGHTGTVQGWESSTDGGTTWTPIANTTTTESYTNLTTTTAYRASVKSGVCAAANSSAATITIVPSSDAGTLSSSMTVCEGANDDTLALTGYVGNVTDWEMSTDGGLTFSSVGSTNDSLFFTNLMVETVYRAIVQAGTCASDNSNPVTISIDAPTVGGTLSSDATVCASGNGGTINLLGQTGSPVNWESSTDNGLTWTPIANITTSLTYTNLTDTTLYRTSVQNGTCAANYSDTVTITVDPITVGGAVNANTTVCEASNAGTLNLAGQTGGVLNWESSTDGGFTWTPIANTTTSQSYLNITENTLYRAVIQSGVCASSISGVATITVDPTTDAGNILGATTVCEGTNSGTLTLVGTTGSIMDWETSTDGGMTWNPVGNTGSTEPFTNLTTTTDYRAIATSGVCPNDTSAVATVAVDALTVGGAVSSDAIVCELSNGAILTLAGHTGSVLNWEMSTDGGSTWIILGNTTNFQNYLNLTTTTSYRANVQNGVCAATPSADATISVSPESVGGAVSSSTTVCENQNFGVLTLTGYAGSIMDWEFSTDDGATWTSLANTGTTQNYTNLSDTTLYRALVQNATCPQDTSAVAYINMYPAPSAAFVQDTVCSGLPMNFVNNTTNSSGFVTLYSWDFGDGNTSTSTNPSHTYSAAGSYNAVLFVMNNFGCSDTVSHPMQVDASPTVDVIASGSTSFCEGDSVEIGSSLSASYSYLWNNGVTTNSMFVDSSYTYVLDVTDLVNGCVGSDSIAVTVFSAPVADAGLDTTVALGSSVILNGTGGIMYLWSPSTGLDNPSNANPMATPLANTVYTLMVTDINGCTAADSVSVTLSGEILLGIYDIITPNGDAFNETWIIDNIQNYPNNSIIVVNRNGQIVFEANGYDNSWDGTRNGDELPEGAYSYIVELTDSGTVYTGTLNIVRSN